MPNRVRVGNQDISFDDLTGQEFMKRLSLLATGHYKSPEDQYDPIAMTGQPHRNYVYGAAVAEVVVDTLTGEKRVTRLDLLHDAGKSLNPALDLGLLEGGFIQGLGWVTT
nr:molybdopterin cofactor-binding domain-containing protein [Ruegeria lacuscaerulensis]